MNVLIVESQRELGVLWKGHIERQGAAVRLVHTESEALDVLHAAAFDIVVLDLVLEDGSALGLADFISYRQPDTRILFVTNTTFFSDGSIFQHSPNACGFVRSGTPPEDLAAMVEHYATAR